MKVNVESDGSDIVCAHAYKQWIARAVRRLSDEAVFHIRQDMDQHVIARVEALVESGLDTNQAIWQAVAELGPADRANRHYRRVHLTQQEWKHVEAVRKTWSRNRIVVMWLAVLLLDAWYLLIFRNLSQSCVPALASALTIIGTFRYALCGNTKAQLLLSVFTAMFVASYFVWLWLALPDSGPIYRFIYGIAGCIAIVAALDAVVRTVRILAKLKTHTSTKDG